jgi:hypothetical protein
VTAIRRVVGEPSDRAARAQTLGACVEIMLAAEEVSAARAAARAAASDLAEIATDVGVPFLHAVSAHATDAVRLAGGDPRAALTELRWAWKVWQELGAPYGAARARVLMGFGVPSAGRRGRRCYEPPAGRPLAARRGSPVRCGITAARWRVFNPRDERRAQGCGRGSRVRVHRPGERWPRSSSLARRIGRLLPAR